MDQGSSIDNEGRNIRFSDTRLETPFDFTKQQVTSDMFLVFRRLPMSDTECRQDKF